MNPKGMTSMLVYCFLWFACSFLVFWQNCRFDLQNLCTMLSILEVRYQLIMFILVSDDCTKFPFCIKNKSNCTCKYIANIYIYTYTLLLGLWLTLVYFLKICSLLHQRYKDFSPCLIDGLLKVFFPGKSGEDLDADRNLKAMKKRSTLKLLLELYFIGIIEDSSIFINIIKDLTSIEHLKDRDTTQTNLTLLASFARQGRIFLGLPLSGPGQEIYEEVQTFLFCL